MVGSPPAVTLRRGAAPRPVPAQAPRGPRRPAGGVRPAPQLLLRRRRLPEAVDPGLGALSRPQGLPRRRRRPGDRAASRADAHARGVPARVAWGRRPDARTVAAVVARHLRREPVVDGDAWALRAARAARRAAGRVAGALCRRPVGAARRALAVPGADDYRVSRRRALRGSAPARRGCALSVTPSVM